MPPGSHPPFDPELLPVLAALGRGGDPPRTSEVVPELRSYLAAKAPTDDEIRRGGAIAFEEHLAPGIDGAPEVPMLVCTPTASEAPRAAIYYLHGGGHVAGTNRTTLEVPLDWAEEFGLTVFSPEYRLAPEHQHPLLVEDCYAGLVWTARHAEELGVDPARIIVAGISAGGNLAAGVALMARDRGGPPLLGQLIACARLDDRLTSVASRQVDGVGTADRAFCLMAWKAVLGDRQGTEGVSPYAAPMRAADVGGLPQAFLDAGSVEIARDDAAAYASRIWETGGSAELHIWNGGFHGFEILCPGARVSRSARRARTEWIGRILEQAGAGTARPRAPLTS